MVHHCIVHPCVVHCCVVHQCVVHCCVVHHCILQRLLISDSRIITVDCNASENLKNLTHLVIERSSFELHVFQNIMGLAMPALEYLRLFKVRDIGVLGPKIFKVQQSLRSIIIEKSTIASGIRNGAFMNLKHLNFISLRGDGLKAFSTHWFDAPTLNRSSFRLDLRDNVATPFTEVISPPASHVTLSCEASGNPRPILSWLDPQGNELQSQTINVSDFEVRSQITIPSILALSGLYLCRSQNSYGESTAFFHLVINPALIHKTFRSFSPALMFGCFGLLIVAVAAFLISMKCCKVCSGCRNRGQTQSEESPNDENAFQGRAMYVSDERKEEREKTTFLVRSIPAL
uniref:Ig-like domain-containing protein n=1 Tax=Eptatretus burgeri TaxID=7764 RepID=A0A8C4WTI1_EPTBU